MVEIIKSHQGDILCLDCAGVNSVETHFRIIELIVSETANIVGKKKVFVDVRKLAGEIDMLGKFTVGERVSERLAGIFIATLAARARITGIGENAAVNRGATMIVTWNKETALKWLTDS